MTPVRNNHNNAATKVRLTFDNWIALIALIFTAVGGIFVVMERRFATLEQMGYDHEMRLTRREANGFTMQEASVLNTSIANLTAELRSQEKIFDSYRSDVVAMIKENNKMLSELKRHQP